MSEAGSPPLTSPPSETQPPPETDLGRTTKHLQLTVDLCSTSRDEISGIHAGDRIVGTLRDRDLPEFRRRAMELEWSRLNERVNLATWTMQFLADQRLYSAQGVMEFLIAELVNIDSSAANPQYGPMAQKNRQDLAKSIRRVLEERVIPAVNFPKPAET
ncbi:hypothetical protein HY612_00680 [Candidatus Roizmanbacteria bacterium]|nr:hypothetical protein [Candidatus Roizmanbacteria bacterium]